MVAVGKRNDEDPRVDMRCCSGPSFDRVADESLLNDANRAEGAGGPLELVVAAAWLSSTVPITTREAEAPENEGTRLEGGSDVAAGSSGCPDVCGVTFARDSGNRTDGAFVNEGGPAVPDGAVSVADMHRFFLGDGAESSWEWPGGRAASRRPI